MYGLPINFNISVLVGKKLNLVCFSANTISLSFEEDVSITIMNSFIYRDKSYETSNKHSGPVSSSNLMCLVGKAISHAEGQKDGMLTLQFDNEHALVLLDDSREYESYIIKIGNKEIIV